MKNKKKDIYGRTYTTFGYCLHIFLAVTGFVSFFLMLGYTGSCELNQITLSEYTAKVIPCLAVFCGSVLLHNKIFD